MAEHEHVTAVPVEVAVVAATVLPDAEWSDVVEQVSETEQPIAQLADYVFFAEQVRAAMQAAPTVQVPDGSSHAAAAHARIGQALAELARAEHR